MRRLFLISALATIACFEQTAVAQYQSNQVQTSRRARVQQVVPSQQRAQYDQRTRSQQFNRQQTQGERIPAPKVAIPFRSSANAPTPKPIQRRTQPISKFVTRNASPPVPSQLAPSPSTPSSLSARPSGQTTGSRLVPMDTSQRSVLQAEASTPFNAPKVEVATQPQELSEQPQMATPRVSELVEHRPRSAQEMAQQTMVATSVEDQIKSSVSVVGTDIIAPPGINVGQEAQFKAVANNLGDENLSLVYLRIHLPSHLEFVRATPQPANQTGSLLEFRIKDLPADSIREVLLTVVPREKQPIRITAETHIVSHDQIDIAVQKPEIHIEAKTANQAIVGDTIHHVIRLTNTGDGLADNLQMELSLPKGMKPLGDQGDLFIGDLAPGMSRDVMVQTQSSESGLAAVEYLVSGNSISAKDRAEIAIVWPELHVELLGPKVNLVNRPGDYTIRLNNPCDIAINDTRVALEIPPGLQVTTLSREGNYNAELRTIEWDLASMQPGAEETIQFRAHLLEATAQRCQVTVQSVETQANQLALETKPYNHTALKVAMRNKTGAVMVGDTAEFEIVASNDGGTDASEVVLEVEIPDWMEPVPSEAYRIDRANSVIRFTPQAIAQASQKELTFEATCNKAGNYVLRSRLQHASQSRPLISDASLFILDSEQEKIGGVISPEKVLR